MVSPLSSSAAKSPTSAAKSPTSAAKSPTSANVQVQTYQYTCTATKAERRDFAAELRRISDGAAAQALRQRLRHVDGYKTPSYRLPNRLLLTERGIRVGPPDRSILCYHAQPVPRLLTFLGTVEEAAEHVEDSVEKLLFDHDAEVHEAGCPLWLCQIQKMASNAKSWVSSVFSRTRGRDGW